MPNITLAVDYDLHKFVKEHKEINWSEVARRAMLAQAKKVKLMEKLVEGSKFTEEDVAELDHKVKAKLLKRYS